MNKNGFMVLISSFCRIIRLVHLKMNAGKEPFKCGMGSAECGVRPNLISVIAKLRAPRPVK
jgi:hypothetical protein